jgi:hypothetical protein
VEQQAQQWRERREDDGERDAREHEQALQRALAALVEVAE